MKEVVKEISSNPALAFILFFMGICFTTFIIIFIAYMLRGGKPKN